MKKIDGFVDLRRERIFAAGDEPGRDDLVHGAEHQQPGQLHIQIGTEQAGVDALPQHLLNELDVRLHDFADRLAQLNRTLPELDLGHVGQVDVRLQLGEVNFAYFAKRFIRGIGFLNAVVKQLYEVSERSRNSEIRMSSLFLKYK